MGSYVGFVNDKIIGVLFVENDEGVREGIDECTHSSSRQLKPLLISSAFLAADSMRVYAIPRYWDFKTEVAVATNYASAIGITTFTRVDGTRCSSGLGYHRIALLAQGRREIGWGSSTNPPHTGVSHKPSTITSGPGLWRSCSLGVRRPATLECVRMCDEGDEEQAQSGELSLWEISSRAVRDFAGEVSAEHSENFLRRPLLSLKGILDLDLVQAQENGGTTAGDEITIPRS